MSDINNVEREISKAAFKYQEIYDLEQDAEPELATVRYLCRKLRTLMHERYTYSSRVRP
jgi:hypothetical protein